MAVSKHDSLNCGVAMRKCVWSLTSVALLSACGGGDGSSSVAEAIGIYYSWMHSEVQEAWSSGFHGQGTMVKIVDAFTESHANQKFSGRLGEVWDFQVHGEWVAEQVNLLAPLADQSSHDFSNTEAVTLQSGRLNIINLSYGMIGDADQNLAPYSDLVWSLREQSIIHYAENNLALVVKAAGNDGVAVDQINADGEYDYLNIDLIGARSAIFVGALEDHGSVENPALLADYSNYAGSSSVVQEQFLVVGVPGHSTGLYGTSFAAPAVSAYAAILGSKFTSDDPESIKNRLLETARTDTIMGYSASVHGRGEASLARALSPNAIQ